jgi:hypothetical protein
VQACKLEIVATRLNLGGKLRTFYAAKTYDETASAERYLRRRGRHGHHYRRGPKKYERYDNRGRKRLSGDTERKATSCEVTGLTREMRDLRDLGGSEIDRGSISRRTSFTPRKPRVVRDRRKSFQKGEAERAIGDATPIARRTLRTLRSPCLKLHACLRHWPGQPLWQRSIRLGDGPGSPG